MKILIVSSSFYPQNSPRSFRTTELAKEFARQGHEVTVLTPKNKKVHPEFEKEHGVTIKDLGGPGWKEVKIKGKGLGKITRRALRRLPMVFFDYPNIEYFFLVKKKLSNEEGYDLMISIAVPHSIHWGVAAVRTKKHSIAKTWVADCGDPFMGARQDTFRKLFYFQYFENSFLKKADFVSVPFEDLIKKFNKKYVSKFKTIPQGFEFENPKNTKPSNSIPTFIYAGTIMPGFRDPFSLIDFLLTINADFRFFIYTKQQHLFSRYAQIIDKKLFIKDYIPREQLINQMSLADFLVNIDVDNTDGLINAIPSKLIDYYLSGRPVLSYEQSKIDFKTVQAFLKGDYSRKLVFKNMDRYKIEKVSQQFLELINK